MEEARTTPAGESLQLRGHGSVYEHFSWSGPARHSRGRLNDGQTLSRMPFLPPPLVWPPSSPPAFACPEVPQRTGCFVRGSRLKDGDMDKDGLFTGLDVSWLAEIWKGSKAFAWAAPP